MQASSGGMRGDPCLLRLLRLRAQEAPGPLLDIEQ